MVLAVKYFDGTGIPPTHMTLTFRTRPVRIRKPDGVAGVQS